MNLPAIPKPKAIITIDDVVALERKVAEAVVDISDIDLLNEWHDQSKALEEYLARKGLQPPMRGAQRRVEARIGQLLGEGPGRGKKEMNSHANSFVTRDREELRILAHSFNGKCKLTDQEWRVSRRRLVAIVRERAGLLPPVKTPGFPDGPFRTIVIDPPWPIEKIEFKRRGKEEIGMDYRRMPLKEIAELPIPKLANAEGTHVYLWVTHKFLPEGLKLFEKWGVRYECLLTWIKPTAQPLWWRYLTEHVLFGKIGSLSPLKKGEAVSFKASQQRHSHKPEEFFDLVRRVSPGPRLTMFDFERKGFKRWGQMHGD